MKQMIATGSRKTKTIEVPMPQINEDQMLVKITLTGMCHSELFARQTAKEGDVFGHEPIGW